MWTAAKQHRLNSLNARTTLDEAEMAELNTLIRDRKEFHDPKPASTTEPVVETSVELRERTTQGIRFVGSDVSPQYELGRTAPGTKHDADKTRYELLPPEFLHATAIVLTRGATKYSDRNWEKGIAYSRCFGALMRHLWAWWGGKLSTNQNFFFGDLDPEWSYSHLWHASCCLAFLTTYEARGMVAYDDRPANGAPPA